MNRIMLLLLAIVAGLLAFDIGLRCKPQADSRTLEGLSNINWLTEKLALDSKQVEEIVKLQADYKSKLEACDKAHCSSCCSLAPALFADEGGDAKSTALIEEMSNAHKEGEMVTMKHIRAIHAVLNTDQKAKFENMVRKAVCKCGPKCKCSKTCGK